MVWNFNTQIKGYAYAQAMNKAPSPGVGIIVTSSAESVFSIGCWPQVSAEPGFGCTLPDSSSMAAIEKLKTSHSRFVG